MTGSRPRVLVVDDDERLRSAVCDLLRECDIDVIGEAADGLRAVQLASSERPDAVVMDLRMPGMNGLDAAGRIHEIDPGIRVILLSAYEDPTLRADAIAAGAAAYIVKGAPPMQLVEAILGG